MEVTMTLDQIIFNILQSNAHTWVRYFKCEQISGLTMPGEYIELRSNYLSDKALQPLLEAGFKIEKIHPQKINVDAFCDVLLKRELISIQ